MAKKYLRKKQVRARYDDISGRTLWRLVRDGRLPEPEYPLNPRIPFWDEDKLEASDRKNTVAATGA